MDALLAKLSIGGHSGLAAFRRMGGHASAMVAAIEGASAGLCKCADALEQQTSYMDGECRQLQAGRTASAALIAMIDQHIQHIQDLMVSVQGAMDIKN